MTWDRSSYNRQYHKKYYPKNRERLIENSKKYAKNNPEYIKQKNKDYRLSHKEYYENYMKVWRENHIEYQREYTKLWRKKNPERSKLADRANRNRRYNAGKLSIKIIQIVYEDNIKKYGTLTCYLCLKPIEFGKDQLEHKIPISRGGKNEYSNLSVSCDTCNHKKRNKTVDEYLRYVSQEKL